MIYIIGWKDRATGICGIGRVFHKKEDGEKLVSTLNARWAGEVHYWLEPVEEEEAK